MVVRGIVQGVGFRPFVYRLAIELGLTGWVNNTVQGVVIEIEGDRDRLVQFQTRLEQEPPPQARIEAIAIQTQPLQHDPEFTIHTSPRCARCLPANHTPARPCHLRRLPTRAERSA